jgi:hypothetical protein
MFYRDAQEKRGVVRHSLQNLEVPFVVFDQKI